MHVDSLTGCQPLYLVCSYEVVLKNKDSKGQLMSLQQTLRQEIHAKIGAQTAEESAKRKVCHACYRDSTALPSSQAASLDKSPHYDADGVDFPFRFFLYCFPSSAQHEQDGQSSNFNSIVALPTVCLSWESWC